MFKASDLKIITSAHIPKNQIFILKSRQVGMSSIIASNLFTVPPIEPTCCVYHKLTGFNDHKCAGLAPNPYPMPKDYVKS